MQCCRYSQMDQICWDMATRQSVILCHPLHYQYTENNHVRTSINYCLQCIITMQFCRPQLPHYRKARRVCVCVCDLKNYSAYCSTILKYIETQTAKIHTKATHTAKYNLQLHIHTHTLTSIGLNLTLFTLSTPQAKDLTGSALSSSQMFTCWPQVANMFSCQ